MAATVVNDAIPAVPPWSCNEVLPARPFGSQKEAVDTAKKTPIAKASPFASYAAISVGLCAFLSDVPREIRGF